MAWLIQATTLVALTISVIETAYFGDFWRNFEIADEQAGEKEIARGKLPFTRM